MSSGQLRTSALTVATAVASTGTATAASTVTGVAASTVFAFFAFRYVHSRSVRESTCIPPARFKV